MSEIENKHLNKNEYCLMLGKRIEYVMNDLGMKQKDILEIAESKGYDIKQSLLSKICNGSLPKPGIQTLVQIADILNIDLNELFSLDPRIMPSPKSPIIRQNISNEPEMQFIVSPDDAHMRPYLNTYHTYFFPTKSDEYEPLHGLLTFKSSDDHEKVIAEFRFKTGKIDDKGKEIEKKYRGEMVISTFMSAAYCWLRNDEIGEMSYIIFNYIPIAYESLYSRIALVITSCAGHPRVPTAHRMIISVPEITQEELNVVKGQLYMNSREILISELGMEEMLKREEIQNNEAIKELFKKEGVALPRLGISPLLYYRIEEATIRGSFLNSESKSLTINMLRQYSSSLRYVKVGHRSDKFLYEYLQNRYDKE